VKEKFEQIEMAKADQLFGCRQEISRGIDHQELNGLFLACVLRVQEVSKAMETT
jgi:hypothetical protein